MDVESRSFSAEMLNIILVERGNRCCGVASGRFWPRPNSRVTSRHFGDPCPLRVTFPEPFEAVAGGGGVPMTARLCVLAIYDQRQSHSNLRSTQGIGEKLQGRMIRVMP
jgi:hypothetical protein